MLSMRVGFKVFLPQIINDFNQKDRFQKVQQMFIIELKGTQLTNCHVEKFLEFLQPYIKHH